MHLLVSTKYVTSNHNLFPLRQRVRQGPTTAGRSMTSPGQPEPAVLVPPRLTSSAYALLVRHGLVARRWHLQGRHGSRTYAIPDGGGGARAPGTRGGGGWASRCSPGQQSG